MKIKIPDRLPIKIKIPKIDEKNRNWVLGGIMLGIFLIDYFLIMQPFQLGPLMKLNPKIRMARDSFKEAEEDIKMVDQYRTEVVELKEKMEAVGTRILSKEEIPKILDNISRLAIASNIQIDQIMPLRDSQTLVLKNDEGKYFSLSILVIARGSYHDAGRFLNRIEKDKIFMSITDFDIAVDSDDPIHHAIRKTIKVFILEKTEDEESL